MRNNYACGNEGDCAAFHGEREREAVSYRYASVARNSCFDWQAAADERSRLDGQINHLQPPRHLPGGGTGQGEENLMGVPGGAGQEDNDDDIGGNSIFDLSSNAVIPGSNDQHQSLQHNVDVDARPENTVDVDARPENTVEVDARTLRQRLPVPHDLREEEN